MYPGSWEPMNTPNTVVLTTVSKIFWCSLTPNFRDTFTDKSQCLLTLRIQKCDLIEAENWLVVCISWENSREGGKTSASQ